MMRGGGVILSNEVISHTSHKDSILSVTHMRAYGEDVDDFPTIFTRDGKRGGSNLITDGHEVKFKLQDGLQMVHIRKET